MEKKTRRSFTEEFKQLVSSGRPLTQVAKELGIQPSMLRHWRDDRQAKSAVTRPAGGALLLVAHRQSMPRSGAWRRELARAQMERNILSVWPTKVPVMTLVGPV